MTTAHVGKYAELVAKARAHVGKHAAAMVSDEAGAASVRAAPYITNAVKEAKALGLEITEEEAHAYFLFKEGLVSFPQRWLDADSEALPGVIAPYGLPEAGVKSGPNTSDGDRLLLASCCPHHVYIHKMYKAYTLAIGKGHRPSPISQVGSLNVAPRLTGLVHWRNELEEARRLRDRSQFQKLVDWLSK